MASWARALGWTALLVMVLPILAATGCTMLTGAGADWRNARRDPSNQAPDPARTPEAVVQVYAARTVGWRGAVGGVCESVVGAMERLGARRERIAAAIGPAIAARSYEVDQAFADRLAADDPANERFFCDGPAGKPHFDLEAYVAARLAAAGVRTVEALGLDTYGQPERFFSYRRATHAGEPDYGRQISLIGLN